jgi:hypothetical protein
VERRQVVAETWPKADSAKKIKHPGPRVPDAVGLFKANNLKSRRGLIVGHAIRLRGGIRLGNLAK